MIRVIHGLDNYFNLEQIAKEVLRENDCWIIPSSCKRSGTFLKSLLFWLAGEVSLALSVSKIKVKFSQTKYRSFYKTLVLLQPTNSLLQPAKKVRILTKFRSFYKTLLQTVYLVDKTFIKN